MEEMAELEETAREKAAGLSLLINRDNEIKGIRDGTILATRVSHPKRGYLVCGCVSLKFSPPEASGTTSRGQGEGVARDPLPPPPSPSTYPNPHPR